MASRDAAAVPPLRFLTYDVSDGGGVNRVVISMANHLARRGHDVEIATVLHRSPRTRYPLAKRVRLVVLDDVPSRSWRRRALARLPSLLRPRPEGRITLLTRVLLKRWLDEQPDCVVISTRPSLNLAVARLAPRRHVHIAQDHLNFVSRFSKEQTGRVLTAAVPEVDVFAVLTEADATDYRAHLPESAGHIRTMRNGIPWEIDELQSTRENKVVVAVGRLAEQKAFHRMIEAWATVHQEHPDWQLHIWGRGVLEHELRDQIASLGLNEVVLLRGFTRRMKHELAEGSVYCMTSIHEGFPMVLIEAMSVGLPLVAMDCPRGPSEIIREGENGFLLPDGDVAGVAAALSRLIADDELRHRIGAAALEDSRQYAPSRIMDRWEELLADVWERTASRRSTGRRTPARG